MAHTMTRLCADFTKQCADLCKQCIQSALAARTPIDYHTIVLYLSIISSIQTSVAQFISSRHDIYPATMQSTILFLIDVLAQATTHHSVTYQAIVELQATVHTWINDQHPQSNTAESTTQTQTQTEQMEMLPPLPPPPPLPESATLTEKLSTTDSALAGSTMVAVTV